MTGEPETVLSGGSTSVSESEYDDATHAGHPVALTDDGATGDGATSPATGLVASATVGTGTSFPTVGVPPGPLSPPGGGSQLSVGHDFGARYHIIRVLGTGGMGAVYQAWDKVLEVAVAVKVIRPDATLDPEAARALEKRFKRELLLARQVTHRNVVRIHDLGEMDGITYITMPYVQGSDLATIIKRDGRLPVDRALSIARQVASGLVAAHDAGVIHRDLKPANIMVDAEDGALIMDFGIARSTSGTGFAMTVAGAVVGTVEYMAPEQARGAAVDQRADIYSFGLILHDMLLGRRKAGASSAVAELMDRMQQAPPSVRATDPTIPEAVAATVSKCLQPDPALRYQTMASLLADLERAERLVHGGTLPGDAVTIVAPPLPIEAPSVPQPVAPKRGLLLMAAAAAALVLIAAGIWSWRSGGAIGPSPTVPVSDAPAVALAILPFRNASGDPTLDSLGASVSQVLGTMLGQSAQVRTVPPDRLHQVLQDLRISPNATLAPVELARVAEFTSARRVLWGQFTRFGETIRIDATLQDLDRNANIPLNAMAPNESALLTAITALADSVRRDLARGSADVLNELESTSWKPSTASFEALRLYNEGLQLTQQGTHQAALKSFEAAIRQDANFALGYSALAQSYSNLGYDNEAQQSSRRAMGLSDALPPQEKYLISANHYRILNDVDKAIESYENLVKASPTSPMVQFDLGSLYEQAGRLDLAREHFARVVALDPKFVEGLLALGRVEIRRGNPRGSLEQLNGALSVAVQLNNDEARGNILQAIGIAYKRLDRPDEALRNYEESLAIKRRLGNKRGMAGSLGEIAQIQALLGNPKAAEQSYRSALALQREIGDKSGTSISLINLASLFSETLGRPDDALPLLKEALQLRREAGNPNGEAQVLNSVGNVYLAKGEYSEAQTYFERALEIRERSKIPGDLADTLHNLAETLARMGRYDQSLSRYHRALELRRTAGDRRGAAIEAYGIGTIFDYQGRYGAAVTSKSEALAAFRELKQRDMWLGEIMSGYGNSLSLSGRLADAAGVLDEATTLARELQNPTLTAQTLRFQAERLLFLGDVAGARKTAEQASQAAGRTSDRTLALQAQASAAMVAAAQQPNRQVAARLASLAQEADTLGLKALSIECGVARAQSLLGSGDRAAALQEIDRTLAKAEPLGFRLLLAKAHFVRGEALGGAGTADAGREYAAALRLLNEIRGEEGNQNVLKRADVADLYARAERAAAAR
jgi:eukaryotic-like serine/threonine-protein kinase